MKWLFLMALVACIHTTNTTWCSNQQTKRAINLIHVSGIVKDADTNDVVEAVTISRTGKRNLAVTKKDGSFEIQVTKGTTVLFSAVSYQAFRFKVTENSTNEIISLRHESKELEGVIVTALGITRKQKALGYSVQNNDGGELTDAKSNNWSNRLSGKVAGLNLFSAGSGSMNLQRISLRSDVSLNPDGNPKKSGTTSAGSY